MGRLQENGGSFPRYDYILTYKNYNEMYLWLAWASKIFIVSLTNWRLVTCQRRRNIYAIFESISNYFEPLRQLLLILLVHLPKDLVPLIEVSCHLLILWFNFRFSNKQWSRERSLFSCSWCCIWKHSADCWWISRECAGWYDCIYCS